MFVSLLVMLTSLYWSTLGLGLSKKQNKLECTEEIISVHSSLAVRHDGEPEYQADVKSAKKIYI